MRTPHPTAEMASAGLTTTGTGGSRLDTTSPPEGDALPPYEETDTTEEDEDRYTDPEGDHDDDDDDEGYRTHTTDHRNPLKRPLVDPEELFKIRKRLFYDCLERPTKDVFYMEGERIDMGDPTTCALQRALFARIFNSMLNFSKAKIEDKNATLQQNLMWEAKLTENRLKKLRNNAYRDYHLDITSAVSYILRALEDIKHIRREEMIFQLVPMTCTVDAGVKERLQVNSLDLRQVNNSRSLSVNLNVDMKFLYAGTVRSKTIADQGEKFYVAPTQCMGAYIHDAVSDLYDLIYDRTKQYIARFFQRYPDDPSTGTAAANVFNETDAFNKGATPKEQNDRTTLNYLLRSVGRDINLRKVDLDKIEVFVLTASTTKTKPKYLNAKNGQECRIECLPVPDTEAVFLTSFTRARIMEDGSLNFQIYSRACVYLSDDHGFPPEQAV